MRTLCIVAGLVCGLALVIEGQSAAGRAVHVTLHEGTSMAAALSPDQRTIAIDLLGTLWMLPAAGGDAKPITDIALDARQPAWSPDGRHIAFQAYRSSTWQIWTANADGGDARPVTSSPYDDREPTWSPDGTRIAFSSDRSGSYDVWVLTLASGALQQVTFGPSNEFMPAWHGADELVYVSDRESRPGMYATSLSGLTPGAPDRLIATAAGSLAAPAFAPDGAIAFNAISGGRSRLMVGERNIADDDEDVFPFRPQWASPAELLYTADGKIKRRPAAGGAARIVEFSADVSFVRQSFTPKRHRFDRRGPQPVLGIMHPAVSPDGNQVAFAALGDLWVMPVDSAPRRLMTDAAVDTEPAWSPDGRSLAYSSDRGGSVNIWIRSLETGADRQLTHLASAPASAAWSRDGGRIACVDSEGQIQVVDVKTGAVTRIHEHLNEPGRPSWSPDGRAVVVSSLRVYSTRFREGTNEVLRVSVSGEPDRWFDPAPHKSIGMREDYGPVWSPDGTQMAAIVDGLLSAWPVAPDGTPQGPPRPLSTDLAGSPTWTADSRKILYQTDTGFKIVDVAGRRVSAAIDPHLTWTATADAHRTVVHAGRLWDGRSDALRTDVDIVVEGTRIVTVAPHRAALHTGTVVDASGDTVIPGLIEIHAHLSTGYGQALGLAFLA
jgi:Tol biopolymer transport system component